MKGQYIYLTIVLLFLGLIISLPLIKVPISTTSYGIVNDLKNNRPIISMVEGRVTKSNIIRNNQLLKKGDTILEINTDQLREKSTFQINQHEDYVSQLKDLKNLTSGSKSSLITGTYQRQYAAYKEKIAQYQSSLELAQKDFNRVKTLYNEGIYTQSEFDKNKYSVENKLREIHNIREQQIAIWQAEKRDVERIIRENSSNLNTTQQHLNNFIIKSPENGRLIEYSGLHEGSFVTPGFKIGSISPEEALVVEARVSPRDIGFIKPKQKVKIQVDTYNYNQWGLITGDVIEVQKNISYDEKTGEQYFIVYCKMEENFLQLKNGYKGKIEKGMTLNIRFFLLERTLWQLLFDNMDDWFNPNLGK